MDSTETMNQRCANVETYSLKKKMSRILVVHRMCDPTKNEARAGDEWDTLEAAYPAYVDETEPFDHEDFKMDLEGDHLAPFRVLLCCSDYKAFARLLDLRWVHRD
eukprot:97094_1